MRGWNVVQLPRDKARYGLTYIALCDVHFHISSTVLEFEDLCSLYPPNNPQVSLTTHSRDHKIPHRTEGCGHGMVDEWR